MSFFRALQIVLILILVAALSVGLQLSFRVSSQAHDPLVMADGPIDTPTVAPTVPTDPTDLPTEPTEPPTAEPEPEPGPKPHRVALTFDDGPYDKITPDLLDGLAERGVRVTFFLLGSRVKGREAIVARAAEEGHQIANHSYSHSNFTKLTAAEVAREIRDTADAAEAACGQRPWMVRPPYGAVNKAVKAAVSEPFIMWSVDPEDWRYRDAQKIHDAAIGHTKDGDIILLHDAYASSVEAALMLIDSLSELGYDFVTVEELFAESGIELEGGKSYFSAPARTKAEPTEPTELTGLTELTEPAVAMAERPGGGGEGALPPEIMQGDSELENFEQENFELEDSAPVILPGGEGGPEGSLTGDPGTAIMPEGGAAGDAA